MSQTEVKSERKAAGEIPWLPDLPSKARPRRIKVMTALLITLAMVGVAAVLGRSMWNDYMMSAWTRDGVVRSYVVTVSPEVSGRIVVLPVADNNFVHKGDLLMVIDPTDYRIAVSLAEAAVQQAKASIQNVDAQRTAKQAQISGSKAQLDRANVALVFARQQATRFQALAKTGAGTVQSAEQYTSEFHEQEAAVTTAAQNLRSTQRQMASLDAQYTSAEATLAQAQAHLRQAQINLERTEIRSPVNGWVTNLLAQPGDYAHVGGNEISVVDADSFWVDGYFEETNLDKIQVGDPAEIKLMGYSETLHGHVNSIARAISVANAKPNAQGIATVNPIFTWVRLAQRIPVRIHLDNLPRRVTLAAGMTASVQIDPRQNSRSE
jgi:multidrug resistance efflux pump